MKDALFPDTTLCRSKVSGERASRPWAGKAVGASCRCVRCRERHLRHQIGWRLKVCDRLRVQQIVVGFIETETAQQAAREAAALAIRLGAPLHLVTALDDPGVEIFNAFGEEFVIDRKSTRLNSSH